MTLQNDIELFRTINAACGAAPAEVWMILSLLGTGWMVYALILPSIIWSPRIFYAVILTTPIAGLMSKITKGALAAPRPPAVLEPGSFILLGDPLRAGSMPSGHTVIAFAAAASIFLSAKNHHRGWLLLLFPLACVVGLSRVAIGVHWPEDVAVGAVIGMVAGTIGARLAQRLPNTLMQPRSWWLRGLSCWGVLCAYMLATQKLDFPENRPVQIAVAIFVCLTLIAFWRRSFRSA